jgi:hypothetical protein
MGHEISSNGQVETWDWAKADCPTGDAISPCTCEVTGGGSEINVDCSSVGSTTQLNSIFATTANFPKDKLNELRIVENSAVTSLDYDFTNGISFRVGFAFLANRDL